MTFHCDDVRRRKEPGYYENLFPAKTFFVIVPSFRRKEKRTESFKRLFGSCILNCISRDPDKDYSYFRIDTLYQITQRYGELFELDESLHSHDFRCPRFWIWRRPTDRFRHYISQKKKYKQNVQIKTLKLLVKMYFYQPKKRGWWKFNLLFINLLFRQATSLQGTHE